MGGARSSRIAPTHPALVTIATAMVLLLSAVWSPIAFGAQSFDQARAADIGVSENGTSRLTGFGMPGECVESVRRWIQGAGGRMAVGSGPYTNYINSPADLVATGTSAALAQAKKGDVIQYTYNLARDSWAYGVHTVSRGRQQRQWHAANRAVQRAQR